MKRHYKYEDKNALNCLHWWDKIMMRLGDSLSFGQTLDHLNKFWHLKMHK